MTPDPTLGSPGSTASYKRGPHWVAIFGAIFTLPLLFVGGSVTTYRVGMAVPDWPTTFGINMFLFNFWHAPFGVQVEHTHRLYGSAVGLATIVLTVWFLVAEKRKGMKVLGVLALVLVIAQGILGGTRVTQNSTGLAALHGIMGQTFFALMVALCVLTGRDWIETRSRQVDTGHLRRRALVTLIMVAVQIAIGAWLRHFPHQHGVYLHALVALAVWSHAGMLATRIERRKDELKPLLPSARALGISVTLQFALGVAAWWMLRPFDGIPRTVTLLQAMVRTGHQTNGALLLAAIVVLTLRTYRHLAPSGEMSKAPRPNGALDWEAVA
ncbi:COX15/CtaA family protein [Singulisphaera sp. PoT]|uniref:COX15/CtaA family protein n=1 Tax=Singulisphaera sp. PoT TaxID=3411797 RepID=UPI003BF5A58C